MATRGDEAEHHEQQQPHLAGQAPGEVIALLGLYLAQNRHESLAEGALCKKTAQEIGKAKCNKKRVCLGPCTEKAGSERLAGQSGDPGDQGQATHGGSGLE